MGPFSIYVIGGEDDETITLTGKQVGDSCRLTCVVRGETHQVEASDFFETLRILRRQMLEPKGLVLFCYGASMKVWPSAMSRDMGQGLKAYKIEIGAPASELAGIFEDGADIIPASVQVQEEFAREWLDSLRHNVR